MGRYINRTRIQNISRHTLPFFQPKYTINTPGDIYEQEADAVAEHVVQSKSAGPENTFFKPLNISTVQRKCAACEEEEEKLQRKENGENGKHGNKDFENYVDGLNNSGTGLSANTKSFFENRMGYDFSNVKIHTDTVAAKSAQSINALAYTTGNHIVFNQNQFQPETTSGKKLLAHELTHVVQQNSNIQTKMIRRKDGDIVDPFDIVEGYTEATVHTMWLDRGSGRARFFTKGGQTFDGIATINATFGDGTFIGSLSTKKDKRRTWDLYHADKTIYKGGLEFSVTLTDTDKKFADISYTKEITIEVGSGFLPKLIDIKKRIEQIAKIASETRVDTDDEKKIISLLADIPTEQSAEFMKALADYSIDGTSLLDKLDSVIDMDENMALHEALTIVRMRANADKNSANLANAPILAWHDVMGFFEQSATFSIEKQSNGKIRITYLGAINSGLFDNPDYKELEDINKKERLNWMVGGVEVDPDQPIIVHDYDRDRYVVLTAQDLIAYQHSGNRKFLENMALIASMATPVGAARTAAGRAFVFTMERVLPAMVLVVEENKLNIRKWFPNWGPKIIEATEVVKVGLAVYGAAQFVKTGWMAFVKLKQVRNARKAMDAIAIADDAAELKQAESVAANLEKQADELIGTGEKLKKELGIADDLTKQNPINELHGPGGVDDAAGAAKSKEAILSEQKKTLFTNISQDTETMFNTEEGKNLKALLEANPDVALFVKYCNSPCFPKLNQKQIGKIREIIRKADIHDIALNENVLKKAIHNKSSKEIDDILEYVMAGVETKVQGRAPNLPQGPSTMPSAEEVRHLPGMANGGDSLKHIKGQWIQDGKIGRFPKQIADKMRGKTYKDFKQFREEFWKLVAEDPDLSPVDAKGKSLLWSESNMAKMKNGNAPTVTPYKAVDKKQKMTLELDHKLALTNEGGVYDMDNIDIVHKQFHDAVGER